MSHEYHLQSNRAAIPYYQQIMTKYQRHQNACGKSHFILEIPGMSKYFLLFGILEVRVFMLIDGKFVLLGGGGCIFFYPCTPK
jgi:hypothetical protein